MPAVTPFVMADDENWLRNVAIFDWLKRKIAGNFQMNKYKRTAFCMQPGETDQISDANSCVKSSMQILWLI